MNKIKKWILKLALGYKADSESYISYLKSIGASIGQRCRIVNPVETHIDVTRPYLINIGDDVIISSGTTILTHGYEWSVLKGVYGDILGSAGKVSIGNNCFIGANTIILKGVTIGNNVIIGAGSVVNKSIPDNVVIAGVPAKIISNIEEYHNKRVKAQCAEAHELVEAYRTRFGKEPGGGGDLREFFWLFENDINNLSPDYQKMMELHGNKEYTNSVFKQHKSKFNDFNDFLKKI